MNFTLWKLAIIFCAGCSLAWCSLLFPPELSHFTVRSLSQITGVNSFWDKISWQTKMQTLYLSCNTFKLQNVKPALDDFLYAMKSALVHSEKYDLWIERRKIKCEWQTPHILFYFLLLSPKAHEGHNICIVTLDTFHLDTSHLKYFVNIWNEGHPKHHSFSYTQTFSLWVTDALSC